MDPGMHGGVQEWFDLMVEAGLTPGLRELGFHRVGRRFRRELDNGWAQISIIHPEPLTELGARFTLELVVARSSEWSDDLRVRPYYVGRNTCIQRDTWRVPLWRLMHVGGHPIGELMWELRSGQPFDTLVEEVLRAVRQFGLPAMSKQMPA